MIEFSVDQKKKMVAAAKMIIAGKIDLIEGCHIIAHEIYGYPYTKDEVLVAFIGVESETDNMPIGSARQYWSSEALALKDKDKNDFAKRVEDHVIEACRALIKRYE